MCYILICASTFPQSFAVHLNCYRGILDPQRRQMVASFPVAAQSAVNRAANCELGENQLTPEGFGTTDRGSGASFVQFASKYMSACTWILIDHIHPLNLCSTCLTSTYICSQICFLITTPLSCRQVSWNYSLRSLFKCCAAAMITTALLPRCPHLISILFTK